MKHPEILKITAVGGVLLMLASLAFGERPGWPIDPRALASWVYLVVAGSLVAFAMGITDIDPLEYRQRSHPDLEIGNHGLTFWDLDREFVVGGFAGKRSALLREILGVLRDSYCRTVGVEYMHIQDPVQRAWFQQRLEQPYEKPTKEEQLRIMGKLNEAEAFETSETLHLTCDERSCVLPSV